MAERERAGGIVFWDVDTQFDFMTPPEEGGKLYVRDLADPADPGATQIVPKLRALSEHARRNGILRVATGDWHSLDHREIEVENPDFRTTYPPHCMAGEQGSEKIPETALRDPIVIPLRADADTARKAVRQARSEGRDIFLQKEEFSCFTGNPATEHLLRELDAAAIVVYGVALDVCVLYAVEGMLDRGQRVLVVADATWALGIHEPEELLAELGRAGRHPRHHRRGSRGGFHGRRPILNRVVGVRRMARAVQPHEPSHRRQREWMREIDLSGRAAIVTGSSKGIGYAIAEALARADANVLVSARNAEEVKQAARAAGRAGAGHGGRRRVRHAPVRRRASGWSARAVEEFGRAGRAGEQRRRRALRAHRGDLRGAVGSRRSRPTSTASSTPATRRSRT